MNKTIVVGVHTYIHDGSICVYDQKNKKLKYIKFERLTGKKRQSYGDPSAWIKYLNHLGYNCSQVRHILLAEAWCLKGTIDNRSMNPKHYPHNMLKHFDSDTVLTLVDHHTAHFYSANFKNGLVADDIGSQLDVMTIFKKNQQK